jgi:hypothetical protein
MKNGNPDQSADGSKHENRVGDSSPEAGIK